MDVCMASPGPDSLMLRGLVELAQTLLKGHLMLQDNYRLYTDIESDEVAAEEGVQTEKRTL